MPDDIRWIRSYVLAETDGTVGTVCIYEASSPEAIHEHARRADMPADEIISLAGAVIAAAGPAVLFAAPASAAPTITFTGGVLTINGDAGNNGLAVGQTPAHIVTLNGSPVLGGTVPVVNVHVVRMNGGAGDDILKLDETNGPMPRGEFDGGEGNDTLIGGSQADTLIGAPATTGPSAAPATTPCHWGTALTSSPGIPATAATTSTAAPG